MKWRTAGFKGHKKGALLLAVVCTYLIAINSRHRLGGIYTVRPKHVFLTASPATKNTLRSVAQGIKHNNFRVFLISSRKYIVQNLMYVCSMRMCMYRHIKPFFFPLREPSSQSKIRTDDIFYQMEHCHPQLHYIIPDGQFKDWTLTCKLGPYFSGVVGDCGSGGGSWTTAFTIHLEYYPLWKH